MHYRKKMGRSQEEWNRFNLSPGDRAKPSYLELREFPFVGGVGDMPDLPWDIMSFGSLKNQKKGDLCT